MTCNVVRLVLGTAVVVASANFTYGEPIASADDYGYEVSARNAVALGYEVQVDVPDDSEPRFKRLHMKFPEAIGDLRYAYSSVVYSRNGKPILSYRPDAHPTVPSSDLKEMYILADQGELSCMSFVNVYFGKSDGGNHPPTRYISVDLASFVFAKPAKCKGKIDARNYY